MQKPQTELPPLIKRQTPEGKDYRIVIPENVEKIIRKFCELSPHNEWSGTLFYEFEGDFNSDSFKIICRDFFLMDLGSGAFTEFDEDGTAIDYMVQHPELLNCQMGLQHSHDTMPTFFSGTDLTTLRTEGFDRNCFVSLIVNNAGEYSAAITRKVEYTEKHNIEITGRYPFFGTGRILELPVSRAVDEKKKMVIEYFDLVVEKHSVDYNSDEYSARFFELSNRKASALSSKYPYELNSRTEAPHQAIRYSDTKDIPSTNVPVPKVTQNELFPVKEKVDRSSLFDSEEFDPEFLEEALETPILPYKLKELLLQILTGCPIVCKWVKTSDIDTKLFNEVLTAFKNEGFTKDTYSEFVYTSLSTIYQQIEPEDYFPKTYTSGDNPPTIYMMENILIIRMISMVGEFDATDICMGALEALREYYSI